MLKFEFTFFIISLKYLGPVPEFCAVSSFPSKLIYFSCWLETEFDFPQSHFYLPWNLPEEGPWYLGKEQLGREVWKGWPLNRDHSGFLRKATLESTSQGFFSISFPEGTPVEHVPERTPGRERWASAWNAPSHRFTTVGGRKPNWCRMKLTHSLESGAGESATEGNKNGAIPRL